MYLCKEFPISATDDAADGDGGGGADELVDVDGDGNDCCSLCRYVAKTNLGISRFYLCVCDSRSTKVLICLFSLSLMPVSNPSRMTRAVHNVHTGTKNIHTTLREATKTGDSKCGISRTNFD